MFCIADSKQMAFEIAFRAAMQNGGQIEADHLNAIAYLLERKHLCGPEGMTVSSRIVSTGEGPALETLALLARGEREHPDWNHVFRTRGRIPRNGGLSFTLQLQPERFRKIPWPEEVPRPAKEIDPIFRHCTEDPALRDRYFPHGTGGPVQRDLKQIQNRFQNGQEAKKALRQCSEWHPGQRPGSEILPEDVLRACGKDEDEIAQGLRAHLDSGFGCTTDHPKLLTAARQLAEWNGGCIHTTMLNAALCMTQLQLGYDLTANFAFENVIRSSRGPRASGAWSLCQGESTGMDPKPLQDWRKQFRRAGFLSAKRNSMDYQLVLRKGKVESEALLPAQTRALGNAHALFQNLDSEDCEKLLQDRWPDQPEARLGDDLCALLIPHPQGEDVLQDARIRNHQPRRNENSRPA